MDRRLAAALLVIVFLGTLGYTQLGIRPSPETEELSFVQLPEGFEIDVYAENFARSDVSTPGPGPGPRLMLLRDDVLYVSIMNQGRVVALPDRDGDGRADETVTFISGLDRPHGLEWHDSWFYIATEGRVVRVRDSDSDLRADEGTMEVLVDDIPQGGHFTRTIHIRNQSLFISVGSSCNVCFERSEWRAAITRCDLDGTGCEPYVTGLRNAVDFTFHGGRMYATDNGRDGLGPNTPPDEINLVKEGKDYGWPLCYGKQIHDSEFDDRQYVRDPCLDTEPSLVDLQAHSASLGLDFWTAGSLPEEYQGDLFVAYHGSWDREVPTGYKVVRIDMETKEIHDFATGWLAEDETVRGRPVGVLATEDELFITDDNAGKVYRITYSE